MNKVKNFLRSIDAQLFKGSLQKYRLHSRRKKSVHSLDKNALFRFNCYSSLNQSSILNDLCDQYGSDKGSNSLRSPFYRWLPHTYTHFYASRFGHCRNLIQNVFECGLGTNNPEITSSMGVNGQPGASLRVWRDYFPSANIYGADIDKDILFEEQRIKTYYVDQLNQSSINALWDSLNNTQFDLFIDDGLHTFDAAISLFTNSFHKVAANGIYVIEDILESDLQAFYSYFFAKNYRFELITMFRPNRSVDDNSMIVIYK